MTYPRTSDRRHPARRANLYTAVGSLLAFLGIGTAIAANASTHSTTTSTSAASSSSGSAATGSSAAAKPASAAATTPTTAVSTSHGS